jgi:hypothetical protein
MKKIPFILEVKLIYIYLILSTSLEWRCSDSIKNDRNPQFYLLILFFVEMFARGK